MKWIQRERRFKVNFPGLPGVGLESIIIVCQAACEMDSGCSFVARAARLHGVCGSLRKMAC